MALAGSSALLTGGDEVPSPVHSVTTPLTVTCTDDQLAQFDEKDVSRLGESAVNECSEIELEVVRTLLANQRFEDARDLVLQLTGSRETSGSLDLLMSEIYIAESKLYDATACVLPLLGKTPDNPTSLQALVKLYRASGDSAKALEVLSWMQLCGTALTPCFLNSPRHDSGSFSAVFSLRLCWPEFCLCVVYVACTLSQTFRSWSHIINASFW
jgi:hypothetical protein